MSIWKARKVVTETARRSCHSGEGAKDPRKFSVDFVKQGKRWQFVAHVITDTENDEYSRVETD